MSMCNIIFRTFKPRVRDIDSTANSQNGKQKRKVYFNMETNV